MNIVPITQVELLNVLESWSISPLTKASEIVDNHLRLVLNRVELTGIEAAMVAFQIEPKNL